MRKIVLISILGLLVACSGGDSDTTPNTSGQPSENPTTQINTEPNRQLISEGQTRNYTLRVPATYDSEVESPLVIVLHGFGSRPAFIENNTNFTRLGAQENFITVYPSGLPDNQGRRFWTSNGRINTPETEYDDIVFIQDLVNSLKSEFTIDENRIYITGNSNGGFMTYRAAFVLSNTFAAAAIHSAQFPNNLPEDIQPQGAVPIMHIHGLEDNVVFAVDVPEGVPFFNAQESVNYWIANNGANTEGTILRDDDDVTITKWESPTNNADVVYIEAKNGVHEWFTTSNSGNIDSSQEIWNFFNEHSN